MHSPLSRHAVALCALASLLCGISPGAVAQSGENLEPHATESVLEGTGSIVIRQSGPAEGVRGEWTLIKPDFTRVDISSALYQLAEAPAGKYTIVARPPAGAAATVTVSKNGNTVSTVSLPQASFTIEDASSVEIDVTYTYTRVGTVSVRSEPLGLAFQLKGPNDIVESGITPMGYESMPEGQYTVYFDAIEGCGKSVPKSDRLLKNGRINFSVSFSCDGLDDIGTVQDQKKTLLYVSVVADGTSITLDDVPLGTWYAQPIATAVRTGIMAGYRNEDGTLTGRFGPQDHVTIAQLAKIAHAIAGIESEDIRGNPENPAAQNAWFSKVIRSAEERDWLVYLDRSIDPNRPATRGEVVATLLQALDVPRLWPTGDMFTDVARTTPYADCIETAAGDGTIAGFTDATGAATGRFGPDQPINRAEISKILASMMEAYGARTPEMRSYTDTAR